MMFYCVVFFTLFVCFFVLFSVACHFMCIACFYISCKYTLCFCCNCATLRGLYNIVYNIYCFNFFLPRVLLVACFLWYYSNLTQ